MTAHYRKVTAAINNSLVSYPDFLLMCDKEVVEV